MSDPISEHRPQDDSERPAEKTEDRALLKTFRSWWRGPAGGLEVMRLALPMIISSGSFAFMLFADRVFLTWFDPTAMAASFSAGQFFWALVAFPFSVTAYANAFVSQYNGAKQYGRIGRIVWQGVFFGAATFPLYWVFAGYFEPLFLYFGHSDAMASWEATYLYWIFVGYVPMIGNEALSAFFSGRKKMKIVMAVNIAALLFNIALDYGLIFGAWGLPAWGLAGAAIATTAAQWFRFFLYLALAVAADVRAGGRFGVLSGCRFIPAEAAALLKFGTMSGVQFFFETAIWLIFILLLGMTGETALTASAIALNLNALSFLPILGIGVAVTSLVGNYIGAEKPEMARRATLSALKIGVVFTGFFMIFYLFFPDLLLAAYSYDDPEKFAVYGDLTRSLLKFVAVYLFFDTVNVIFCSAIKGAGDMWFVMGVSFAALPFLTLLPWVGIAYFGLGVYWCWIALTLCICLVGLIYGWRFYHGKWMKMRLFRK